MNQKDLIKYALIGVGVYLVYQYLQQHGGLAHLFGTTTTTPVAPPATTTTKPAGTTTTTTPASTQSTLDKIQAAAASAGQTGTLNVDQWCYFYAAATGAQCPDPATFYAGDRTAPIDAATFWNALHAAGVNGLGFLTPAWRQTPQWLM